MNYITRICIQNYDFGDYIIVSEYNEFIDNLKIGDAINFEGIIKPLGYSNIDSWTNINIYGTICGLEKTIKTEPKEKSIKLIQRVSINIGRGTIDYIERTIDNTYNKKEEK